MNHRLRRAREEKALTQEEVANQVGVRPNTIYRHEAGIFEPTEPVLKMLAQVYGKPVEWFYGADSAGGGQRGVSPRKKGLSR